MIFNCPILQRLSKARADVARMDRHCEAYGKCLIQMKSSQANFSLEMLTKKLAPEDTDWQSMSLYHAERVKVIDSGLVLSKRQRLTALGELDLATQAARIKYALPYRFF